ncbi:N-acetylglucosaminyldiphosphoundecaprenol N-acetyl-beta-D-mannosaminyltransferase [Desulfofundulus luciae]|uniref:N-acetylglucosaminyldiphosphoundecaprenol N-acetyl-beta-D-mannosaminyltransferase n=1 Tax=Desulfofundulus luciae TaxID=74702 RepID=A0ABU0AX70_9FIRM|nr:WecB/TagA/CpsF family glycosyltransferase [Desulfofundulus luciae]MDQ0285080.1 N-acetylglucosaminyldiphosphoundecaprenol N-acetyl-beta-D-mannosaminyltransferase [Desulfofundulus luciae]
MHINLLGARVDAVDLAGAVERVAAFVATGRPHQVITLNPEILYRAQQEPELLALINRADLVTADGIGIVWAAKVAGTPVPGRVTGIDLMLALVSRAAREGWRIFLLGAAPGVAEEAARRLKEKHPGLVVAGTQHGYFKPAPVTTGTGETGVTEWDVVEQIRAAQPDLLFVALGAPKQEKFIARHKQALGVPVAMGVGGSFDVIAGRVARAPVWMQRLHLEWLGRLLREPRRWRRMLVLPRFAWLAWRKARLGK